MNVDLPIIFLQDNLVVCYFLYHCTGGLGFVTCICICVILYSHVLCVFSYILCVYSYLYYLCVVLFSVWLAAGGLGFVASLLALITFLFHSHRHSLQNYIFIRK